MKYKSAVRFYFLLGESRVNFFFNLGRLGGSLDPTLRTSDLDYILSCCSGLYMGNCRPAGHMRPPPPLNATRRLILIYY